MIHNLFTFYGADHKVGTTMISQSVSEIIASNHPNLKLLQIAMNGRESAEYFREPPAGIDSMKFHIDNKMVSGEDFQKTCAHKGNYYILSGISNESEARYYHPDMATYVLEELASEFDLIIADGGSELDNGLSIGALSVSEEVILVATQQESAISRFEKSKKIMEELGIDTAAFVINKYYGQDPYSLSYISERLEVSREKLMKVDAADYSRQAEIDRKTLLDYRNEAYLSDIRNAANHILVRCGLPEIRKQRKSRWKSFI